MLVTSFAVVSVELRLLEEGSIRFLDVDCSLMLDLANRRCQQLTIHRAPSQVEANLLSYLVVLDQASKLNMQKR